MAHVTDKLAGYLEGGLPDDARARVERHLDACPRCRAALADMRAAGHALAAAGRTVTPPAQDGALWSRVRAQIAPEARRRAAPRWAFAGAMAVAAVAIIAVATFQPKAPRVTIASKPDMMAKLPVEEAPAAPKAPSTAYQSSRPAPARAPSSSAPAASPMPALVQPVLPDMRRSSPPAMAESRPAREPLADARRERAPLPTAAAPMPAVVPPAPPPAAARPAPQGEMSRGDKPPALFAPAPEAKPAPRAAAGRARPAAPAMDRLSQDVPGISKVYSYSESSPAPKADGGAAGRLFGRAQSARALGKPEPAKEDYEAALKAGLPPTQARLAHIALAEMAGKSGDDRAAATHYAAAMDIAKDAPHLVHLGAVYERLHEPEKAAAAYRQALALAPNNAQARAGLARVRKSGEGDS